MDQYRDIKILYVEDQIDLRNQVEYFLKKRFTVITASNGFEGIKQFKKHSPDLILSDHNMPVTSGITMSQEIKKISPETPIILMTAYESVVNEKIKALDLDIARYYCKPVDSKLLLQGIYETLNIATKDDKTTTSEETIWQSKKMKQVIKIARKIADTDWSVLIEGESGTGKTFLASTIHQRSYRKNQPFRVLDLGRENINTIETTLFGYEKGAYTGAVKQKKGIFEEVNGGTLLIDDLQNCPPEAQLKLLHVLDEKQITRVGGSKPIKIDVRIILTSNINLEEAVKDGYFREDLYYRLRQFIIDIPPIRERKEEIEGFIDLFLGQIVDQYNQNQLSRKIKRRLTRSAVNYLKDHPLPGNLRTLKKILIQAVAESEQYWIKPDQLKFNRINNKANHITVPRYNDIDQIMDMINTLSIEQKSLKEENQNLKRRVDQLGTSSSSPLPSPSLPSLNLKMLEKMAIKEVLRVVAGNREKAAQKLGISSKTLYRKILKHNIEM